MPLRVLARSIVLLACLVASPVAVADAVLYVTDVEGSRAKLERAFEASGDFERGEDGFWTLKPGRRFVYGGDAPDRFSGSLWVTEQLARLVEANGPRARVILGNRDGNKPRLTGELAPEALAEPAPWFSWLSARSTPPPVTGSRAERLRWIYAHTMGAPAAFELRRRELAGSDRPAWADGLRDRLSRTLARTVAPDDDELVVESALHELRPGGAMARLLYRAELGYRYENTLYLHGGASRWNFGRVPGTKDVAPTVADWLLGLERWYRGVLARWEADRDRWDGDGRRAAEELVAYMMPVAGARSNRRSVVTGRSGDGDNMPWLPPRWVIDRLLAEGISRLVLGHTPSGDAPTFVRTRDGRFEVICADNSYGLREDAPTILRIERDRVRVVSAYRDGAGLAALDFESALGRPSPLGLYTPDGALVVGLAGTDLVAYRMQNYRVSYRRESPEAVGPLREGWPADEGAPSDEAVVLGDFDPPTLADRTRVAVLLEQKALDHVYLVVRKDSPAVRAAQPHRAEMTRRLFADMASDVTVLVEGRDAVPSGARPLGDAEGSAWDGASLPGLDDASSALARARISAKQPVDFLHPDVRRWIGMHGLYRPLAPLPCIAAVLGGD